MCTKQSMHFYLTARHFDLTDSIRDHVQQHLVEALTRHVDASSVTRLEVQLTLGQRDARFGCHVLVQLTGHRELNVTEEGVDLYAAIDRVQKRLLRGLTELRKQQVEGERAAPR